MFDEARSKGVVDAESSGSTELLPEVLSVGEAKRLSAGLSPPSAEQVSLVEAQRVRMPAQAEPASERRVILTAWIGVEDVIRAVGCSRSTRVRGSKSG